MLEQVTQACRHLHTQFMQMRWRSYLSLISAPWGEGPSNETRGERGEQSRPESLPQTPALERLFCIQLEVPQCCLKVGLIILIGEKYLDTEVDLILEKAIGHSELGV